jgi:hypothetical protein
MKIRPTRAVGAKAQKGGYSFDNGCVAFGTTDEVRQKNIKKKKVAHEFMTNKRAEERDKRNSI